MPAPAGAKHLPCGGQALTGHALACRSDCGGAGRGWPDGASHFYGWINLRDINAFDWPGYDLVRSAPGGGLVYGQMARGTFARVVEGVKVCAGRRVVGRD